MSGSELSAALRRLGLGADAVVLVHSSLRSLAPLPGRAAALLDALREVTGPGGTVVVPTFTPENSRTSSAYLTAVRGLGPTGRTEYHRRMKPFDPATTPSATGLFTEYLRTSENAVRSAHPQTSFAAVGPRADFLTADHALNCHLGEESPLSRLYDAGALVLLIGVGYGRCTAFHLAEYRYHENPPVQEYQAVVLDRGERRWRRFRDIRLDDSDFELLGKEMEREVPVAHDTFFGSELRMFALRDAVDFAKRWLRDVRIRHETSQDAVH
ncbi:aminoglycoside N(3)-acetyltransferase [Actinocorallia populi]|uniref:aminoglycoside N(3)-acetyltransferase n=1 Tax=Actinocorallia populi TaxID=2079200 RepID=UPI000D0945CD|nr:AAC(3) family N-acetyltransferase [Actinocorallia populi]